MPLVTGNWRDILNAPMLEEKPEILFTLNKPNMAGGTIYPSDPVVVTPKADGSFSVNLASTQDMVDVGWYTIKLRWLGLSSGAALMDFPEWKITVPRSGGVISNLLDSPGTNQRVVWVSLTPPVAPRPFMLWLEQDPQATESDTARLYEWRAGGWSPHGHGSWAFIADLKGAPGYNATGAAEDMQTIADYILGLSGDNPVSQAVLNRGPFIDVHGLGAKGDGATNDTAAIQAALDLVRDGSSFHKPGSGTVYLRPGVYRVEAELNIYRGTTLLGEGATLKRHHSGYLLINGNRGVNQYGYDGHGNLRIIGVTLDANAVQQAGVGSTFTMSHAHDVLFERVKFLDATSHAVDCNASRKVRFVDCDFLGYRNTDGNTYVEAIQIDLAVSGGFPAFGAYDCTPCQDVTISGCRFGASANYGPHVRGVGSHGSRIGAQHQKIRIESCTFQGLPGYAIRPYNWSDVDIVGNWIAGPNGGVLVTAVVVGTGSTDNTMDVNGVQTGASEPCYGIRITNNTVISPWYGVRFVGEPTGRFRNCHVTGNRFFGQSTSEYPAVNGVHFRTLSVSNNDVVNFNGNGMSFTSSGGTDSDLLIEGNSVQGVGGDGIYISAVKDVRIVSNMTQDVGLSVSSSAHVRIAGGSNRVIVSGHNAAAVNSTLASAGIYVASDVTNLTRTMNIWAGSAASSVVDNSTNPLSSLERV